MKFGLTNITIDKANAVFSQFKEIDKVILFGSRAKGNHKPSSDIDLTLVGKNVPFDVYNKVAWKIDDLLLPYRFDISIFQQIEDLDLIDHINRVGEIFYKREMTPASEWKKYKLGELGKIITGKTPPTKDLENFGTVYPFITPVDMHGQKYIYTSARNLSEIGKDILKNYLLPSNTICVSCIGSDLGKVVKTTTSSFTNQQINSIICDENFNSDFVYYALKIISPLLKSIGHNSTAVPIINKTDFSLFEISVPIDILIQKQIASILSSLDDKIELNRQTNQTLEVIAQTLFKEMCLPKGEELPEEWRVGKLGDVMESKGGTTPSTKNEEFWNGEYNWVTPKDLSDLKTPVLLTTERTITEEGLKQISSGLLPKGTLLMSSRAPIGYFALSQIQVATNQGFIAINGTTVSNLFLLHWLKFNLERIKGMANGSTFLEISKTVFRQIELVIPNKAVLLQFENLVKPLFDNIITNEQEIQTLTTIRDSLLPKLMKGEINFSDE